LRLISIGLADDVSVAAVDKDVVDFWESWWTKWHRRIRCISTAAVRPRRSRRRGRRTIRAIDVSSAWIRLVMPAVDPDYVMPDWWLALTVEEKRTVPHPQPVLRPRRVRPASERSPGFSLDDIGPYLKLPDGSVYRDRRTAAHRLWRRLDRVPDLRRIIGWLPGRSGREGQLVKGRTPTRILDALVCYGLVRAGMSQAAAAGLVLDWAGPADKNAKKMADENRAIWRELRLPVSE
jgi:hypothetical protein